ncbi:MAG TPA: trimethylamine methyltransferase family protein [Verrucomicrobiae bacterium]|nr:trimethylamine methyltransferase family protein [Verrucomicrobiae bacterium]
MESTVTDHRRPRRRNTESRRQSIHQLPWRQVRNPYPPIEPLSADQIQTIHLTSLDILKEIGMRVLLPEARTILKRGGALVDEDTQMVRFDPHLIEHALSTVPSSYTVHARNPERNIVMGGNHMNFGTVGGPPYALDIDRGRRPGTLADFTELVKLAHSLNIVHFLAGSAPEAQDVAVPIRHMVMGRAVLTLSDKIPFAGTITPQRMRDFFDMVCIVRGITEDQLLREPSYYSVINTNSPLQLDGPMAHGVIEMAKFNQPLCITPFTLLGAMAPVTLAGALTQQNAEALAAITLSQLVRPGAPLIYGGFTSNVDMRSGAPAFGTPEYIKAALIGGQMARRYKMPYRSSNTNASNWPDAQATYEGAMSIWGAIMGHCNMMIHGIGWLEGGLVASYEKYIIDAEMLQIMSEFCQPVIVDESTLAVDAMRDVGPGGHFFGTQHTLDRYETAFYTPLLSDWRTFQQWSADGAMDATKRANKIWKTMLAEYVPPPLDPARAEALDAFIARRTEEGGAPII